MAHRDGTMSLTPGNIQNQIQIDFHLPAVSDAQVQCSRL